MKHISPDSANDIVPQQRSHRIAAAGRTGRTAACADPVASYARAGMSGLDDVDVTNAVERIFGSDLMALELGRMAELYAERAPAGHARYHALLRLDEASDLLHLGHAGPAAVVAQSVAEGYFQEVMEALFSAKDAGFIHDAVKKAFREFRLSRKEHLGLYEALSDDVLTQAPPWAAYRAGVKLRNRWVHDPVSGPEGVTPDGVETFILAVIELIAHVEQVLTRAGVKSAQERYRVERRDAHGAPRIEATVYLLGADEQGVNVAIEAIR